MATEMETRVLVALSAIEVPPSTAKVIAEWGNEAVSTACDLALGDYPGLEPRVRANAVAMLGWMDPPQARETIALLLTDSDPDIIARALRATAHQRDAGAVPAVATMLQRPDLSPVLAAEAVDALGKIGSPEAVEALKAYADADEDQLPHRRSEVVAEFLSRLNDKL